MRLINSNELSLVSGAGEVERDIPQQRPPVFQEEGGGGASSDRGGNDRMCEAPRAGERADTSCGSYYFPHGGALETRSTPGATRMEPGPNGSVILR